MADELDKFEAQLIAYLDGELSPADALALEQKLAAYPQHRSLMEEMRQQRELLLGLPPEAAPEALKAQLRGQVAQAGPGGLSHRRLYRIAASILLMLGAGIVVHQFLPQPGAQAPQYATRMEPTPVNMELGDREAAAKEAFARTDERVDRIVARKTDAIPGVALAQSQQARQQMFANSNSISNSRTVISVASDNPTVMQAEIGRLLRDNRIAYSQEAEIPADTALAAADTPAKDGWGMQPPYASKGQGPVRGRGFEDKVAVDRVAEKAKDADVYANSTAADQTLNQTSAKSEKAGKVASGAGGAKQSNAKPAAPAAPATPPVALAPAPNAAAPVGQAGTQAAGERGTLQKSLTQQQVLVARNVSSGDVAQIEQALRDRQVGQKLRYRVTDTSNSQMASPAALPGSISHSQLNVAATTQPAAAVQAATTPIQAKGGAQTPAAAPAPASQQPTAQQAQQAEQTMDLLIVVEPETK